jgi:CBS domain containing-hemolysin-like protein
LIINELGRVPAIDEKLEYKGLQFEVVDADSKRVNRVRIRRMDEAVSGATESKAANEQEG